MGRPQPDQPASAASSGGFWRSDRAALLFIVAVWADLAVTTWAHWGNPRVDCGREMYVPWQILEGRLLYRDLWYLYGPLAPYLKALLYAVFGVHLNVLYALGLANALGIALTLFHLGREFLPRIGAAAASLCFLIQAFQPNDLWNFILPYSYAAATATWLGVLCLLQIVRYLKTTNPRHLAWAAWAAAAALLDKQEFGLVCYVTLGAATALRAAQTRSAQPFKASLLAVAPGLLAAAAVYGFFGWKTGLSALVLENFQQTPQSYFMQTYGKLWLQKGGFRLGAREILLLSRTALTAVLFWWCLGHSLQNIARRNVLGWLTLGGCVFAAIPLRPFLPDGLMLWAAAGALWWGKETVRGTQAAAPLFIVALYGCLLGLRTLAAIQGSGYAVFYNTIPLLLLVVGIARLVPQDRLVLSVVMIVEVAGLAWITWPGRPLGNTWPLTSPRGKIYAVPQVGAGMAAALEFVSAQTRAGKSLVLLPEEMTLHFLAGIPGIEPWYQLTPGVVAPAQEERYLERLRRRNPDFILISNRTYPEYGTAVWGRDFNASILAWITNHYAPSREIGPRLDPDQEVAGVSPYQLQVYERKSP